MLNIPNITCKVGRKVILSADNIQLNAGQFSAIVGPNGAGKSTLLKAIAGDISYAGKIIFHNLDLHRWSRTERARHLGVLPQSSQLNFTFRATDVVALGLTPLSLKKSAADKLISDSMHEAGCLHLKDSLYPTLSGGEKQRVQLARVLLQISQASKPPLLLLDEPTSAQDLGQQHAILELVKKYCRTKQFAVLAIIHDLNLVLRYCDHCFLLNGGELMEQDRPKKCLQPEKIQQYWGYRPQAISLPESEQMAVI